MNIFISAVRRIIVPAQAGIKVQLEETQTVCFNEAWQTPTKVTYQIAESANPAQAYIDWVMAENIIEHNQPIYGPDDFLYENPVAYVDVNHSAEHVEKFKEFMRSAQAAGFTLQFEAM